MLYSWTRDERPFWIHGSVPYADAKLVAFPQCCGTSGLESRVTVVKTTVHDCQFVDARTPVGAPYQWQGINLYNCSKRHGVGYAPKPSTGRLLHYVSFARAGSPPSVAVHSPPRSNPPRVRKLPHF